MNADDWELLRHVTLDNLVTTTKRHGSCAEIRGWTTPEGWPFVIVAAVAKPGDEAVITLAQELREKLLASRAPVVVDDRDPWPNTKGPANG